MKTFKGAKITAMAIVIGKWPHMFSKNNNRVIIIVFKIDFNIDLRYIVSADERNIYAYIAIEYLSGPKLCNSSDYCRYCEMPVAIMHIEVIIRNLCAYLIFILCVHKN